MAGTGKTEGGGDWIIKTTSASAGSVKHLSLKEADAESIALMIAPRKHGRNRQANRGVRIRATRKDLLERRCLANSVALK